MTEIDLWLVPLLMALLVGVLCPVTSTLLVTQRRVLQANLISHAVLPGVAVAVAFGLDPAIGGVLSGLLGSLLAERLQRGQSAGQEAVINTVLAGFLGLGVLSLMGTSHALCTLHSLSACHPKCCHCTPIW